MEKLRQLAKVRNQALKELQQVKVIPKKLVELSVIYGLYSIDWRYLIENEVERWLLEMEIWANRN